MSLEDLTGPNKFLFDLVRSNPEGSDLRSVGDDHLRGIKNVLKNTFPNLDGAVTLTQDEINDLYDSQSPGWTKDELVDWAKTMIGMVCMWNRDTPPDGWLECNGQAVNSTTYPELFNRIGPQVPDMRGLFVRGYDPTGNIDPDGQTRPEPSSQSIQLPKTGRHTHEQVAVAIGSDAAIFGNPNVVDSADTPIADESRPINVNMMYIIKHDDIPPRIAP